MAAYLLYQTYYRGPQSPFQWKHCNLQANVWRQEIMHIHTNPLLHRSLLVPAGQSISLNCLHPSSISWLSPPKALTLHPWLFQQLFCRTGERPAAADHPTDLCVRTLTGNSWLISGTQALWLILPRLCPPGWQTPLGYCLWSSFHQTSQCSLSSQLTWIKNSQQKWCTLTWNHSPVWSMKDVPTWMLDRFV